MADFQIVDDWMYSSKFDLLYNTKYIENIKEMSTDCISSDSDSEYNKNKYKRITFILTNYCNLSCKYCYSHEARKNDSMTFEQMKVAVDQLFLNHISSMLEQKKESKMRILYIGGGEPTTKWGLLESSIEYIRELSRKTDRNVDISLVTNGQWSSRDRSRWLSDNIDYISFSIDGTRLIQNMQRPGEGYDSFQSVVNNIQQWRKAGKKFGIRATITSYGVDKMVDIVDYFKSLKPDYIQLEPLYLTEASTINSIDPPNPDDFVVNYFNVVNSGNNCKILSSLDIISENRKNGIYCSYENGDDIVVIPGGHITSCVEISNECDKYFSKYARGKIENGEVIIWENKYENKDNSKCMGCVAYYHCGGGCARRKDNSENDYQCYIKKKILITRLRELVARNSGSEVIKL